MARKQKKVRWTRSDGAQVIDEADLSGLSDDAFAKERGLDPQRIKKWRGRLGRPRGLVGRGERASNGRVLKASKGAAPGEQALQFVEVRTTAETSGDEIEIRLRNGRSVLVTVTSATGLCRLLDMVEGRGC